MNLGYTYATDKVVLEAACGLPKRDRDRLQRAFEQLTDNPFHPPDFRSLRKMLRMPDCGDTGMEACEVEQGPLDRIREVAKGEIAANRKNPGDDEHERTLADPLGPTLPGPIVHGLGALALGGFACRNGCAGYAGRIIAAPQQ